MARKDCVATTTTTTTTRAVFLSTVPRSFKLLEAVMFLDRDKNILRGIVTRMKH